jgi:trans-aconitate methyltransferase
MLDGPRSESGSLGEPDMGTESHWDAVYRSKQDNELSWFQEQPGTSLPLVLEMTGGRGRLIDVGGGSSRLIDHLLEHAFSRLVVLDISQVALNRAKARLAARAEGVEWIRADVTAVDDVGEFDVWHDRAVFHFLTDSQDRQRYA